jgi:hypothetical protein
MMCRPLSADFPGADVLERIRPYNSTQRRSDRAQPWEDGLRSEDFDPPVKPRDSFLRGLKSVVFLDHLIEENMPSSHMVQGDNLATAIDPEPKAFVLY